MYCIVNYIYKADMIFLNMFNGRRVTRMPSQELDLVGVARSSRPGCSNPPFGSAPCCSPCSLVWLSSSPSPPSYRAREQALSSSCPCSYCCCSGCLLLLPLLLIVPENRLCHLLVLVLIVVVLPLLWLWTALLHLLVALQARPALRHERVEGKAHLPL